MRPKLAALTLAIAALVLLPSRAKADTFIYQVTATTEGLDVIFDSPTFQESIDTTTFTKATSSFGPVTEFELSGDSTNCSLNGLSEPGPCWQANTLSPGGGCCLLASSASPSFSGPGTFTATDSLNGDMTTVTITDVPSATPEPSSLLFLGCGLLGLLAMAGFGSRIQRFASS